MGALSLNIAYVILLTATLMPTGIKLRIGLVFQNLAFVAAGFFLDNRTMMTWNAVFFVTNSVQTLRLIREQSVELTDEEATVRERLFPSLSPRSFLALWTAGHDRSAATDEVLIDEGQEQNELHLVLDGSVAIRVGGEIVGRRATDRFVGEFSFLNPAPATATVTAVEPSKFRSWSHDDLRHLDELEPVAARALRDLLAGEVSRKMQEPRNS